MPTRITITLPDDRYKLLKTISDGGGGSMSSLVLELIDLSVPMLESRAKYFEKMNREADEHKKRISQVLSSSTLSGVCSSKNGRK